MTTIDKVRAALMGAGIEFEEKKRRWDCLTELGYPIEYPFYLTRLDIYIEIHYAATTPRQQRLYELKSRHRAEVGLKVLDIYSYNYDEINPHWLLKELERIG